ncbi:MAG: right-handed parallel beta-helix repeat-containing protein [Anaerolineae bacterium]|nr:right-handed parallel beta-helix repeat-containing protein [Anaerolineae bacterium]
MATTLALTLSALLVGNAPFGVQGVHADPLLTPTPGGETPDLTPEYGPGYFVIQAEAYGEGGPGVSYQDTTVGNQGGALRHDDVDIKALAGGGYALGWMATGEWLDYEVDVPETGWYHLLIRAATTEDQATLRVEVDGARFAVVLIPKTDSYEDLREFVAPGGMIEAGRRTIRFHVQREYFDLDWVRFEFQEAPPPTATPLPIPTRVRTAHADSAQRPPAPVDYGPYAESFSCPDGAVMMQPGETLQAVVDANPPGTTFCLAAGTHQNQTIRPRTGDTYIGLPGAIMDGGNTTRFAFHSLFAPNQAEPIRNVTVRGLTIQRYASQTSIKGFLSPEGAVEGGEGWRIEGNVIQDNVLGISLGKANWGWGDGSVIRNNRILNNSEMGVEINGSNIVFEYNELAGNGWALNDRDRVWAGGGSKFTDQDVWVDSTYGPTIKRYLERGPNEGLVIRNNHVHSNVGIGLWLDVYNRNAIIEDNLVEENYGSGIMDELNVNTTIRNNVVRNNRKDNNTGGLWGGAEILIVNSEQGDVYNNDVTVSGRGRGIIMIYESYRNQWPSRDYTVYENTIRYLNPPEYVTPHDPIGGITGGAGNEPFWTSNNTFDRNTYYVRDGRLPYWFWGEGHDWDGFRSRGQEANGRCLLLDSGAPCSGSAAAPTTGPTAAPTDVAASVSPGTGTPTPLMVNESGEDSLDLRP